MRKEFLALFCILPLVGFSIRPGLIPADTAFTHLISAEQKENITELRGGALTYQGYNAFLKFTASKKFLDYLESSGRPRVSVEELKEKLEKENRSLQDYLGARFSLSRSAKERITTLKNEWKPEEISDPILLEIPFDELENEWTHGGEELILIDQSTWITYYKSSGA